MSNLLDKFKGLAKGTKITIIIENIFVFTGRFRKIHLRRMWIDDKRDLSLVNARLFLLKKGMI